MKAKIVIDQLTVENFGPYYGKTTFDFRPVEGKCGILIGGRNGTGKTYLLRALYLAVIGEKGVDDLKKEDPDFDFNESRNRKAKNEGKPSVRLEVQLSRREESGSAREHDSLKLIRQVNWGTNGPPVWYLWGIKNNGNEERNEKRLKKLLDNFLPRHLTRFFFIDAERQQRLKLFSKDVIIEGISRILGLWNYTELEKHLRNLSKSKIPNKFQLVPDSAEEIKLTEIRAEIKKSREVIEALDSEKENKELDWKRLNSEISEIDEKLKSAGSDPAEIQKEKDKRKKIEEEEKKIGEKLEAAWEKALPIALLGKFRKGLHSHLKQEESRIQWEQRKEAVEPRIPEIEEKVFILEPSKEFELSKECFVYYRERLRQALNDLFNPPPPDMPEIVYVCDQLSISAQIRGQLAGGTISVSEIKEAVQRRDILSANLRELEFKLKKLTQDREAIEAANELREEKGRLYGEQTRIEKRLKEIKSEVDQLKQRLQEQEGEEKNQKKVVQKAKKGQSLKDLSDQYQETAKKICEKAANENRAKIAQKVGELWIDITKRGHEFLGMHFDKHWNCFLDQQPAGDRVTWDEVNPSAGQRQVQILAFHKVLRQLAQQVPPMVVDTPLAKLDQQVRKAVLNKIYLRGHQSVILATDAEMDPDRDSLFQSVKNQLARVYTLETHEDQNNSCYEVRVVNNYFGKHL